MVGVCRLELKLSFHCCSAIKAYCCWSQEKKKKKKTISSMSTPAAASLTVSGQAGKAFILSVAALKSLTQSRCNFQGTF